MKQRHLFGILGIAALSLLSAAPAWAQQTASRPKAIATIFSYYDILRSVGGDRVDSRILIPARTSPHEFDPSVQDKIEVTRANLIIKNGLGLDDWIDKLGSQSKATVITVSKNASVLKTVVTELDEDDHDHDHDKDKKEDGRKEDKHEGHHHDHGPDASNPHIWLDPIVQMKATEAIRDALIKIDPAGKEIYKANADKYLADLKQLDSDFKSTIGKFKVKNFIGFHSAYDYLARRYGLKQVASLEEVPGSGVSPAQAQKIIKLIKDNKIKVIFTETAFDARSADLIIRNTGVKTAILQPIETYDNVNDSYISLMRQNLENLKQALGSQQ